jgi:hypothetical protein
LAPPGLPSRDLCAEVTEAYSFEGLRYLNQLLSTSPSDRPYI